MKTILHDKMICPLCEIGKLNKILKDLPFSHEETTIIMLNVTCYACDICNELLINDNDCKKINEILYMEDKKN